MRGVKGSITFAVLISAVAALSSVLVLIEPRLRRSAQDETLERLLVEARLLARVAEEPLASGRTKELSALIEGAGRGAGKAATLIAADGKVLADSGVTGQDLPLENLASRPEVQAAVLRGTSSSVCRAGAAGSEMLCAAVAVRHEGNLLGVIRLERSTAGLDAQITDLRRAAALSLGLALAIGAAFSVRLSRSLGAPIRDILEVARQFAGGDFAARVRVRRADEIGELARALNQSADHLQKRHAEISQFHARIEAILSAMDDGVLAVDHRGIVLLANQSLRTHLDLKDPVGSHYMEALRQREVGEVLQEVLRTGLRFSVEVELHHLRRAFSITGVPFPGSEGMPQGAVLTFHDVTERRRLDRVRRDFVANASHELRTPLTSIRGFVEALEDGAASDPRTAERFLGKIHVHADRMAALVEDLLELSRLESGERPPRWEEILPSELVDDVVASFLGIAEKKSIGLVRARGEAPPVVTDVERLRRILENLVDNAVKYTPVGGKVEVSAMPSSKDGANFEVRDNGPGIETQHLPRIFERFYRVDKARSRDLGGTGLGLAIVKHLAEGMGASVTVASRFGEGTTFTVTVPAGREHLGTEGTPPG